MIDSVRAAMALDLLLARQAGVISREQALRGGLSAATVDRWVRTRRWRPLHPRVYLVQGYEIGDEARARAAVLWVGAGAVLSGAAAAWWHGLLTSAPPTVSISAPVRRPGRPGIAVRWRLLDAADRAVHRGLAVTGLGLTVLDAAVEVGGPAGERLLDRALQDRACWVEVLAAYRRTRTPTAARLLSAAVARSTAAAEAALVGLLRGSGLRGWHRLPARGGGSGTVVFPAARVAVEASGLPGCAPASPVRTETATRMHADRDSRGRSAGAALRPGWRLLRFDRAELTGRPRGALATIAAAVDGRDLHHLDARTGPSTGNWR